MLIGLSPALSPVWLKAFVLELFGTNEVSKIPKFISVFIQVSTLLIWVITSILLGKWQFNYYYYDDDDDYSRTT